MDRRSHGLPIEEAPLWVLAIFAAILWLVLFPAVVGFLDGAGRLQDLRSAAGWALIVDLVLVVGLATRRPWRRPRPGDLADERPLFVRFSTWLIGALVLPNLIHGILVISRDGRSISPEGSYALGLLLSAIHGLFALHDRWRRRREAGRSRDSSGILVRRR